MKKPTKRSAKSSVTKKTTTKKSSRLNKLTSNKLALFALIAIPILVIAGTIWYQNYQAEQKLKTVTGLMSVIRTKTAQNYSNIDVYQRNWVAQMGSGIPVPAPGYDFTVNSQAMPTIYFTLIDDMTPKTIKNWLVISKTLPVVNNPNVVQDLVDQTLTEAGYSVSSHSANGATYVKDDNTCLYSDAEGVLTLSCYSPEDVQAAASKLQPFVDAYVQANSGTDMSKAYFGPVDIKSSEGNYVIGASHAAGYGIAEMLIANLEANKQLALFYNKQGGNWNYVTQAGDEFGFRCAAFMANAEVRKVFYDQICYLDDQTGQIRLDTSNRATQ